MEKYSKKICGYRGIFIHIPTYSIYIYACVYIYMLDSAAVCTKMENQNLISISKKEKINASRGDARRDGDWGKEQEKESGRERERERELDERFDREKFKSFHFLANKQRFFFGFLHIIFLLHNNEIKLLPLTHTHTHTQIERDRDRCVPSRARKTMRSQCVSIFIFATLLWFSFRWQTAKLGHKGRRDCQRGKRCQWGRGGGA